MKLLVTKSLWGMTQGATLADKLHLIREAGYDGVECPVMIDDAAAWGAMVAAEGLYNIVQVFPASAAEFRAECRRAVAAGARLITSQSGIDRMSWDEGCAFFREALAIERDLPVAVAHETHRGKLLYAPWVAARYLREFEDLRVLADFSHWCCVAESLLDDPASAADVALACSRAIHIHARVGHEHGPQVPDPSAPEYARHLAAHEAWWDTIHAARAAAGADVFTVTPEFGPPGYMPTLPHTRQPVADLWTVCAWMRDRVRARWG